MTQQNYFFEPIPERATRRTCADCLRDYAVATVRSESAVYWRFGTDKLGGKDKSTRTPVCLRHKELAR